MPVEHVVSAVPEHTQLAINYQLYRDYLEGRHRYDYCSPRFRTTYGWMINRARRNLMPAVVASFTDRISISSWGTSDALDKSLAEGLNRIGNMLNAEAFTMGDAFTITWKSRTSRKPRAVFIRAEQMVPVASEDDPDQLVRANRYWIDTVSGHGRANVYDNARLERWVTKGRMVTPGQLASVAPWPDKPGDWQPYDAAGSPAEEPHDFGAVPVCWWKRDATSQYGHGRSILTEAIPEQDEYNKHVIDKLVAGEQIAAPTRWALADELPQPWINPVTGKPENKQVKFDATKQNILALTAKSAGQFAGPNADHLIKLEEDAKLAIAEAVGLPAFYLGRRGASVPSGESLRVESSRMLSAISDYQQDATPVWRGQMALLGHPDVEPEWADAMPLSAREKLELALLRKELGYPMVEILRDLGEQDPEKMAGDIEAAQLQASERAARSFAEGNVFGL